MKQAFLILIVLALSASIQAAGWTCKSIPENLPADQKFIAQRTGWSDKHWAETLCGKDNIKEVREVRVVRMDISWGCKTIPQNLSADQKRIGRTNGWKDKGLAERLCGRDNIREIRINRGFGTIWE